jgi:hypothetical protein
MVSLPVKVVLSRPLSFSPFLPMVPNTAVRRHLTHSSLFLPFLPRTAWYEWEPDSPYQLSDITISAGDVIRLTAIAFSATSGEAVIENLTNGESVEQLLTSDTPLCGQTAEWIVEDFELGSDIQFANFGTVTFTDTVAGGPGGSYDASQGDLYDIEQNNVVLTSTTASGSSVTIQYV